MFHRLRSVLILVSLVLIAGSILLLLDFTAPNPTGRRFSSEMVDLRLDFAAKGLQAEHILSRDLGIPRNEDTPRACVCRDADIPPQRIACNVCVAYVPALQLNRRPDFLTDHYLIEVKNHGDGLYQSRRDMDELGDYIIAALAMDIPLWVYLRTDLMIPDDLAQQVRSTGGDVLPYLRGPGHVDQVTQVSQVVLIGSSAALLLLLLGVRYKPQEAVVKPVRPQPHSPLDDLEAFALRSKEKARREIDQADGPLPPDQ